MNEDQNKHESDKRIRSFIKALELLTDEEKKALRLCAHQMLPGSRYESPDDLLHESIYRSLCDSRKWREGLDTAAFLYQSMRSIVSVDKRTTQNSLPRNQRNLAFEDWSIDDQLAALGHWNLPPESLLMLREQVAEFERQRQEAREQLAADPAALAIFEARIDDKPAREIKASLGLDDRIFTAADERARQAFRKAQGRI